MKCYDSKNIKDIKERKPFADFYCALLTDSRLNSNVVNVGLQHAGITKSYIYFPQSDSSRSESIALEASERS